MVRKIIFGNQEVTTHNEKQFQEQLALMEEAGIEEYTVEELSEPSPQFMYSEESRIGFIEGMMAGLGLTAE